MRVTGDCSYAISSRAGAADDAAGRRLSCCRSALLRLPSPADPRSDDSTATGDGDIRAAVSIHIPDLEVATEPDREGLGRCVVRDELGVGGGDQATEQSNRQDESHLGRPFS